MSVCVFISVWFVELFSCGYVCLCDGIALFKTMARAGLLAFLSFAYCDHLTHSEYHSVLLFMYICVMFTINGRNLYNLGTAIIS